MTTWKQSVERARAAQGKSFEARMEIAAASLEQFGWQGEDTPKNGKTLEDFADEIDISLQTLWHYRSMRNWLGGNLPAREDVSYTMARVAMQSGKFETVDDLEQLLKDEEELPTEDAEGEEVHFDRWTTRALETWIDTQDAEDPWRTFNNNIASLFAKMQEAAENTTSKWFGLDEEGRVGRLKEIIKTVRAFADGLDALVKKEGKTR
jgi:hypothetical protein